jgi:ATP-dependent Clp protease ATP-binding subunit ClpA
MFERFTSDARNAVVEAQIVARQAGSRSIESRHVLVGLAEGGGRAGAALEAVGVDRDAVAARLRAQLSETGLDATALASLGIDLAAVRRRADQVFGEGALDRATMKRRRGHIPFTSDAKKSLELALREAVRAGSSEIHDGHLLLGILRNAGSQAELELSRSLAAAGTDAAALRSAVDHPEAQAS